MLTSAKTLTQERRVAQPMIGCGIMRKLEHLVKIAVVSEVLQFLCKFLCTQTRFRRKVINDTVYK